MSPSPLQYCCHMKRARWHPQWGANPFSCRQVSKPGGADILRGSHSEHSLVDNSKKHHSPELHHAECHVFGEVHMCIPFLSFPLPCWRRRNKFINFLVGKVWLYPYLDCMIRTCTTVEQSQIYDNCLCLLTRELVHDVKQVESCFPSIIFIIDSL